MITTPAKPTPMPMSSHFVSRSPKRTREQGDQDRADLDDQRRGAGVDAALDSLRVRL